VGKTTWSKEEKMILDIIKPFGYTIEKGRKHRKIRNQQGHLLIAFAGTASDRHWYKNVINDLIKRGHLPGVDKKQRRS
jgi:hypothetical protein